MTSIALKKFIDAVARHNVIEARSILVENPSIATMHVPKEELTPAIHWVPAIHWAVNSGSYELVKMMIDFGANVFEKCKVGWTPIFNLRWAEGHELSLILELFLSLGVNVNDRANSTTLLHVLAQSGKTELCKLLLEKGADKNALDSNGWTPFMIACDDSFLDTAMLFVSHGADTTIVGKDGRDYKRISKENGLWTDLAKEMGLEI